MKSKDETSNKTKFDGKTLIVLSPEIGTSKVEPEFLGISDLMIIQGGENIHPPPGYERLGIDLNSGNGGPFLYLCYSYGGGSSITDLAVIDGNRDSNPQAPEGFTLVKDQNGTPISTNHGGDDGDHVWCSYTRAPREPWSVIYRIGIIISDDDSASAGSGFSKIGIDLNEGAGPTTPYIYLIYQRFPYEE